MAKRDKADHPIDAHIREWLRAHVHNEKELSIQAGHGNAWLHKYINGNGAATVDDLVRVGAMLLGVNLPELSEDELKLVAIYRSFVDPDEREELMAYAKHRESLAAQRDALKSPSELGLRNLPAKGRRARGTRRGEKEDPK